MEFLRNKNKKEGKHKINNTSFVALRLLKAGGTNAEITDAIQKVAASYDCKPVEGVLSHHISRFVLDGTKVIITRADPDHLVDLVTFAEGDVYW